MRILYIIDSVSVGGAETLLLDILKVARDRGHEAHVAYFTPGPLLPAMTGVAASVTGIGRNGLRDPRVLWRTFRLIRRLAPDVVHTHLTKSDLVGMVAATAAMVPRRILTLHNTDQWRQNPHLAMVYRSLTSGAHHMVAVSDKVAEYARSTRSCNPARLVVVPNGVDLSRFAQITPHLPSETSGTFTFSIIGRLQPQKDHRTFLAAAASLSARQPSARFLVVGDGPLRADLEAETAALGLSGAVTFTGNRPDIAATLASSDSVVLSSAWEGLPMVLLESMAAGRPVVATAVGEIPAVLRDGLDGLVVPPGQPEALARAMERLMLDPPLVRALAGSARLRVADRNDASVMHDRIFALYTAA